MIIERSARVLGVPIYEDAALEIARRSRGTPRIANALLRRVRDFAEIKGNGEIEIEITKFALNSLNVDEYGLDDMDNKIMRVMIENFKGKPVGISALATSIGENPETPETYQIASNLIKVEDLKPGTTMNDLKDIIPGWGHDLPEPLWPQLADAIAAHAT
jgi:Holliday junction resolvasome RuvABC ATP-dependent DNA helicase subunit